jgi:single-strand DNA-binding protein
MLNNSGVNKVLLVGYIGKQPRRHTFNDMQMLCFPLVTQEFIKKNGERTEHLEWHQIKVPINSPGVDYNIIKGNLIYLQGKIQTQQFVDEQGIKRYKTEIIASFVQLLTVNTPELQQPALL